MVSAAEEHFRHAADKGTKDWEERDVGISFHGKVGIVRMCKDANVDSWYERLSLMEARFSKLRDLHEL